jgi:hypothetical protein
MNPMTTTSSRGGADSYRYCVYGVGIVSDSPLNLPAYEHDALCDVQLPAGAGAVLPEGR